MNNSIVLSLEQLYGKSTVATFVCDEHLNICWANPVVMKEPWFMDSAKPKRLSLMFPDVNFTPYAKMIANEQMSHLSFIYKQETKLIFAFVPLGFNDENCHYSMVTLIPSSYAEDHSFVSEQNMLPVISITSQPYRNAVFGLFNVISILANAFDKKDMYEELAYLNSLAYNFYTMMRTTLNINMHYSAVGKQMDLKTERVNLNKFCRYLGENIAHILSSSNIDFSFDITDEEITTMADLGMLSLGILNVIYNSCTYSDLHPQIFFSLKKQGTSFVITVTDNGIGIRQDLLPYVFDPFFSETSKLGTENNTGLGLTIVQEVAELHGGVCIITSEPYKGTTVSVKCPIRDDLTRQCGLSVPPSPYLTRRLSLENIFLAEIGKYSAL